MVTAGNVSTVITGAVAISTLLDLADHEIKDGQLRFIFPGGVVETFGIKDLSRAQYLASMASAARHGFVFDEPDRDHHLFIEPDGLKWLVGKDGSGLEGARIPQYESYEYKHWFSKIVSRRCVFVDIGANSGGYAIRGAAIGAQVIAVEPDRVCFSLLKKNAELNGFTLTAHQLAAGSAKGRLPLYGHFTMYPAGDAITDYVDVVPLDELIPLTTEVDMLKVDVENYEGEVLRGAQNVLKRTKYLMVEIWNREVIGWLKEKGFIVMDYGTFFSSPSPPHQNILLGNRSKIGRKPIILPFSLP